MKGQLIEFDSDQPGIVAAMYGDTYRLFLKRIIFPIVHRI